MEASFFAYGTQQCDFHKPQQQNYTMDVVIPGHSVRPFCAAVACLSRVGKELYVDFDPIDGLILRALNDSKSVYSSFSYEPSFFTRCSTPPAALSPWERRKSKKRRQEQLPTATSEERYGVRIHIKSLAPVIRPRKDVVSLQLLTEGDGLIFEFQLQRSGTGDVTRVLHKVGVASAQGVAAVTAMEGSSEIVAMPRVLSTMLDPLKRASEIALLVQESNKLVSSVTFHHEDIQASNGVTPPTGRKPTLKTETSVSYEDLVEVHYSSRPATQMSADQEEVDVPPDLAEQVVLVFTQKELKALLQFCIHSHLDQELQVTLQFFWGGRPIVVQTKGEGFSVELVMATLDYKMLANLTGSTGGQDQQERQQ